MTEQEKDERIRDLEAEIDKLAVRRRAMVREILEQADKEMGPSWGPILE